MPRRRHESASDLTAPNEEPCVPENDLQLEERESLSYANPRNNVLLLLLLSDILQRIEGYVHRHFGSFIVRALKTQYAADLTRALLHDGDAKVSDLGGVAAKPAAIVANREIQGIDLITQVHRDVGGRSVSHCIRYRFLSNAHKMMNIRRRQWNLLAFYTEGDDGRVARFLRAQSARKCMGEDIRHVSRIPQVPDDAPRLGLTVGHHATGQIAGLRRRSIDQSAVAKDFRGCFQLPGDGGEA